jgi:hypothetical protein
VNGPIVSIGTALALVFGLASTEALASTPTPASGATWSPNQRVEYRWRSGDEPPQWMRAAINAAAQDSNESRGARAAFLAPADDGAAWVAYTADIPSTYAIGYAVRYIPDYFTLRMRPHLYPLDWGTLRWCQAYDSPPTGCYDAEMIALHEFGHAQTLGHVVDEDLDAWTDSIMHVSPKSKAKAGWNQHEYGRCDVARLQIRYEPLTSWTKYSTCLDLGTELSLATSSATSGYGRPVTLTARLTIADDAVYPSLAGDPLAGRRVSLQRRVPGSTAWGTIVQMESDAFGRYTSSITVMATYEYRAVFTAPSDEGVGGSSSSPVRVSLTYDCAPQAHTAESGPQYQPIC